MLLGGIDFRSWTKWDEELKVVRGSREAYGIGG
jgi:hypothetical protein